MPRPTGKKREAPTPPRRQPSPAHSGKRWRWIQHQDGSRVAERIETRPQWERGQAEADIYGGHPMLSTGSHLRSAASVLTELLSRLHVEESEIAPEMLAQAWQQAVGDFLSTQAELVSLDQGSAFIKTSHPAVRFELERHKRDIIRALNHTLGEDCVRRVRITHG